MLFCFINTYTKRAGSGIHVNPLLVLNGPSNVASNAVPPFKPGTSRGIISKANSKVRADVRICPRHADVP